MNIKRILKHGLKETWTNYVLVRKAFKAAKNYKDEAREVLPPSSYSLLFKDDFKTRLNTDAWRLGQPWGDFHPGNLSQYYDMSGNLSYTSPDGLVLELRNIPKTYKKSELPDWRQSPDLPEEFTIPTGVGLVVTKEAWQYGWFEAWIKLPEGQKYWPAFWLSGKTTWPPEIDILEAYSHMGPKYDGPKYFNTFGNVENLKIQPNLHYGIVEEGTKDAYGSYDVPVAKSTERFVQYVCHWEKDFIKIYYDGGLIFETYNPEILKWYNRETDSMNIILNHGRHEGYPNDTPNESAMIIKNVKVYQSK
jgi:hypothetical protein